MQERESERLVDDLLDAALKQYHREEPRAGLEGRILAGVQAGERVARRRSWAWALATGTAAGLAVAWFIAVPHRRKVAPPPIPSAARAAQPAVSSVARLPQPAESVGERPALPRAGGTRLYNATRVRLALHRPEQFPTPRPLTEEEKLLLLYVKQESGSDFKGTPKPMGKDSVLEIPELNVAALDPIKPLSGSEEGPKN